MNRTCCLQRARAPPNARTKARFQGAMTTQEPVHRPKHPPYPNRLCIVQFLPPTEDATDLLKRECPRFR